MKGKKINILKVIPILIIPTAIPISEERDVSGQFGLFMRSLNNTSYGYQLINDPTGSAPSKIVSKFEVRQGDCSANKHWNDCKNDRERSELSERYKTTRQDDSYWYSWYIYLPIDFQDIHPAKVILGQFHQTNSHPAWLFQQSNEGFHLANHTEGYTKERFPLVARAGLKGHWHHIVLHVHWTKKNTGFLNLWVNGINKVNYKGKTMSADRIYFKYGLYRAFISRYKRNKIPTQSVFYSKITRSLKRLN